MPVRVPSRNRTVAVGWRVGLCRWPGSSGCGAGSTVAKGSDDHHTYGPTGRTHRTTHRIVSATGAPGGANATVDRAGARECRLAHAAGKGCGDPSGTGTWAAECRSFAGLAGSLRACRQRSCWSGSGSAPAGVVRQHAVARGDGQHLQAADRRLLSLICRPCQALGNAAQREYQAVPVDGAVSESSRGVPLAVAAQASPGGDPGATAAPPVTVPARTAVHSG